MLTIEFKKKVQSTLICLSQAKTSSAASNGHVVKDEPAVEVAPVVKQVKEVKKAESKPKVADVKAAAKKETKQENKKDKVGRF